MPDSSSYTRIFKSTFLFSFVRVFQIVAGIIKNKAIAVLLGPEGIGIIGILSNSVNLLQSGAGLGISQSAVRDISEARYSGDKSRFSRIISLTNKIILFTCLLGCIIAVALSSLLSKWTFGDNSYTLAYIWMGLVVGLNILTEGQLAILKGMRQLRAMAKASIIGSIVGLFTAVPMYYFFGKGGIVPSLIVTSISAIFFSNYFVRKIKYERINQSLNEIKKEASPMVRMGVALMLVGFLGMLSDLIIASYIRSHGGIELVGYYRAGTTIISSYFGIVLTAMTTDYYPRISAVYNDDCRIQEEFNKQSIVGSTLIFPIAIIFIFLSPFFIKLLYTEDFLFTISYTDFALIGTILVIYSDNLGMILLAKQDAKIFIIYSLIHRVIFIPIYILLFNKFGIAGLGLAYLINITIQFFSYAAINKYRYNIIINNQLLKQLLIILATVSTAIIIRRINAPTIKIFIEVMTIIFTLLYVYFSIKRVLALQ